MTITIRSTGRRHYVEGTTYPIRDRLRAAGAHWDPDAKAWWTGDRAVADRLVQEAAVVESTPTDRTGTDQAQAQAPGEGATVAGRAKYKGKTYYLAGRVQRGRTHWDDGVQAVSSRDGSRLLLYFRDGSRQFWAAASELEILKTYDRPQTAAGLARYAQEQRQIQRGDIECPHCVTHGAEMRRNLEECPRCGCDYDGC